MKFAINALTTGRFKKPVCISVPSTELNGAGETKYNKAHFVAEFINVSDDTRAQHQKVLSELQAREKDLLDDATYEDKKAISDEIKALNRSYVEKYFVGFEKHPKHEFPFVDDEEKDISSTSDNIRTLLEIQLIREQVIDVYNEEINKNHNAKMSKLMSGNLAK